MANTTGQTTRDIARELARRYSTMTHDELDELESVLIPRKYQRGEIILSKGEVSKDIYWIAKGLVRLFYEKNGKELTEHLAVENSIIMSIESLFQEKPTHLQIMAVEPTLLYAMPRLQLERKAIRSVNIQMLYRKILEESLIHSQIHADMMRFESAKSRYERFMKLHPQVVLRAPLVYVASFLQMTPETLSRVRAASLNDEE